MDWDFFVSHASEDSTAIARPLARYLMAAGYRTWFDEFELHVGDSLRARIDEGLSRSAFGVVVLSPAFFGKKWPQAELDGLFARDSYENPRLLPVWHGISAEQVAAQSPLIAARLAATGADVRGVGQAILQAARRSGLETPSTELLARLSAEEVAPLVEFFLLNPAIVAHAAMTRRLLVQPCIAGWGGLGPEFVFTEVAPSARVTRVHAIMFGPVRANEPDELAASFANAEKLIQFAESLGLSRRSARPWRPDKESWSGVIDVTIVACRRTDDPALPSTHLPMPIDGVRVRTYDWLREAAEDVHAKHPYFRNIEVVGPNTDVQLPSLATGKREW